jgi:hypothetical protein
MRMSWRVLSGVCMDEKRLLLLLYAHRCGPGYISVSNISEIPYPINLCSIALRYESETKIFIRLNHSSLKRKKRTDICEEEICPKILVPSYSVPKIDTEKEMGYIRYSITKENNVLPIWILYFKN